jgi:prepilin-type N-terminal cleavage/methylation domain-containing protein
MERPNPRGVALPELLLVLLVLGMLAAAVIPRFVYSSQTRVDECASHVALLNAKMEAYTGTHGRPPADAEEFRRIVAADMDRFPNGMPRCPYGRPYDYDPSSGKVIAHKH